MARKRDKVETNAVTVEVRIALNVHFGLSLLILRSRFEISALKLRRVIHGKLLKLFEEALVLGVPLTIEIEAVCGLNWCQGQIAATVYPFDVVIEVDVACELLRIQRRVIPVNYAEGQRELVRIDLECIFAR